MKWYFSFLMLMLCVLAIAQEHPNIILIMTDQHRGDYIGKENSSVITPHLDQLANDGFWFSNAYSSVPSCTPARAGLLTGMSPWQHGMLGYFKVAEKYPYEMPQMLRDNGYYTIGIGKMHWHPQRNLHGFHQTILDESGRVESEGFVSDYRQWFNQQAPMLDADATGIGWNEHRAASYVLAENLHPTYWTAQTAISFINAYKKEQPLFMKISFARPHSPYDPPKRFLDLYDSLPIPKPFIGEWADQFADFPENKDAAFGSYGLDHALNSRRHYLASITFIDEQIGKLIRTLKANDLYDNTLIFFVSDHGDMLGDHHHWRKTYAYEGSTRIPFIVKWPKDKDVNVAKGSEITQCVELRDVLPTMLSTAGIEQPLVMDGLSLRNIFDNESAEWRSYIDLEHATTYERHNYWCALTDGKMKYIWFFRTGEEQLFDLINDKGECLSLHSNERYKSDLKKWRKRMCKHLEERGEPYVRNGQLQAFDNNVLTSPNYPE